MRFLSNKTPAASPTHQEPVQDLLPISAWRMAEERPRPAATFRRGHSLLSCSLGLLALCASGLCVAMSTTPAAWGAPFTQDAPAAQPGTAARLLGTVVSTQGSTLVIKLENGSEATLEVSPNAKLVRTAPGEKTLAGATAIHLEDLATGDRVLARATPGADATHFTASAVIAMKQADIAQAHAGEAEDWQRRGVAGVVKTIDPLAGTIVIATATPGKTTLIHTSARTVVRRYATDSVQFADAKTSTLDKIHVGDQIRARGDKNDDESVLTAEEVVAGSFHNIAGTVNSVDAAHNTLTLTDLATKKQVTLQTTSQSQLRELPPEMAQRLAARFKAAQAQQPVSGSALPPPPVRSESTATQAAGGEPAGGTPSHQRGDLASMLQRAPVITLAALKKGDAVMIVASQPADTGTTATAITLLSGVEPLLESPSSANQGIFSASWNMGGSPAEGAQ